MIRAKFTVTKSAEMGYAGANGPHLYKCYRNGVETDVPQREITMDAIYGGESEDESFAEATPSGSITFILNNPDCAGAFRVGSVYYVDFTSVK